MNGTESGSGNRAKLENGSNANANGNGVQLWKQQQQQQEGLAAASQKGRANEVEEVSSSLMLYRRIPFRCLWLELQFEVFLNTKIVRPP